MHILITDTASLLAQTLIRTLGAHPRVSSLRVLHTGASGDMGQAVKVLEGDLRDPETASQAVAGVDRIVHLQPLALSHLPEADHVQRLDTVIRGTYGLMRAATDASVARFVLGSTLGFFERMPAFWQVTEMWRPRPAPTLAHLLPWLAELSVRELVRRSRMQAICLRFGAVVDDAMVAGKPFDPDWVHVNDAVHGIERALSFACDKVLDAGEPDWHVFHIMAAGSGSKIKLRNTTGEEERLSSACAPFLYRPRVDFAVQAASDTAARPIDRRSWPEILAPPAPIPSRPMRNAIIFGAGGPMGASTAHALHRDYTLTLADIQPLAQIRAARQAEGAPDTIVPPALDAPHTQRIVDVRDPEQVMAACEGMDAIINVSVLRSDPVNSFLVNAVGVYNMARAAVHHGIRRFVQTSPLLHLVHGHGSHLWDYRIPVTAAGRPYESLYFHSKYLGQAILQVFAEYHDLEAAAMMFWELVHPDDPHHNPPFFVAWADSGRALRAALEAPSLPSPYEEFNVSTDLPHDKLDHRKIREVLGWKPSVSLDHFWQDRP